MPVHSTIRFYDDHLFARFHHHTTLLIIIIVVGYLACDRPAREGFDRLSAWRAGGHDGRARGDPSQHRTAQQRQWEENGSEPSWRCDCKWHFCVLLSSPDSTLGLVLVDGGGIIIRVVLF